MTEAEIVPIEEEPKELARRPTGTLDLLAGDPKALAERLELYSECRKTFVRWLWSNLIPGKDFACIHRKDRNKNYCVNHRDKKMKECPVCEAVATLLKPGAEKICGFLELEERFTPDQETIDMIAGTKERFVCLKCTLYGKDGAPKGEGRGARNLAQEYNDLNKAVKMAQKSAYIDATLRVSGVSEMFTQDLDDLPHDDPPPRMTRDVQQTVKDVFEPPSQESPLGARKAPPGTPDQTKCFLDLADQLGSTANPTALTRVSRKIKVAHEEKTVSEEQYQALVEQGKKRRNFLSKKP